MEAGLRRANTEAEARKIFARPAEALDHEQAAPASAKVRATRTIEALAAEYTADKRRGKAPRTIQGRESRVNAHVLPAIGHVPVAKWRVEHSQQVMDRASKTVHSARDVRTCAASWRRCARWRGAGNGWIAGSTRWTARRSGGGGLPRPDAADKLCGPEGTGPLLTRLPLFGTKIRVAGFGGLRLGEQNACARPTWDRSAGCCGAAGPPPNIDPEIPRPPARTAIGRAEGPVRVRCRRSGTE